MLTPIPLTLAQANEFVEKHHRHHRRVQGHKFSIGCESCGELVGVVIAGRPVSRYLDDGFTLEVTRLCTLGGRNVCSFLYAAAARTAKAMGYRKIITYTLDKKHTSFEELTPTLLNTFIEKILVHEVEIDAEGKKHQEIEIVYNFIGSVELPEEATREEASEPVELPKRESRRSKKSA